MILTGYTCILCIVNHLYLHSLKKLGQTGSAFLDVLALVLFKENQLKSYVIKFHLLTWFFDMCSCRKSGI